LSERAGVRVLIVEDEGIVALMLEDQLEELGYVVAASLARLGPAWEQLEAGSFDFAVLDVNVAGETSFDFALALAERGIPFVFSTGYGTGGLPPDLQDHEVLTKPFAPEALREAIATARGG
jgi:CheY-like chemotaxis protein